MSLTDEDKRWIERTAKLAALEEAQKLVILLRDMSEAFAAQIRLLNEMQSLQTRRGRWFPW